MLRRLTLVVSLSVVGAVIAAAPGCKAKPSSSSSAALSEMCVALTQGYAVAGEFPSDDVGNSVGLFRKLANQDLKRRMNAARKLLAHSECHSPPIMEAGIRVSAIEGDPRVVADLAEIVTQRGYVVDPCDHDDGDHDDGGDHDNDDDDDGDNDNDNGGDRHHGAHHKPGHGGGGDDDSDDDDRDDDDDGGDEEDDETTSFTAGAVPYGLQLRMAAAAALGRILERDRVLTFSNDDCDDHQGQGHQSHGQGHGYGHNHHDHASDCDDEGGDPESEPIRLSPEDKIAAINALKLASCVGEPTDVRSAAIEALGIARDDSVSEFLELIFSNPQAPDDSRRLFLQALAGRSLTNIKHNNHLVDSGIDAQLRELADAIQADQEAQP